MRLSRLIYCNVRYYWRTNLAVVVGVAVSAAVLSGALFVGQSIRESLRSLLFERIGATECAVSADRFFREELAEALGSTDGTSNAPTNCPLIYLQGVIIHEGTGSRALNVNVYGVDHRFWEMHSIAVRKAPEDRAALVGATLAQKLKTRVGDGLLLRIETQSGIPRESLYGRRENVGRTVRLICGDILPAEMLGEFSLHPSQGNAYSIFVPLQRLQKDLALPYRVNAILFARDRKGSEKETIRNLLREKYSLEDLGIVLQPIPSLRGITVESTRLILEEPLVQAVFDAAAEIGMRSSGLFTYLANSIRAGGREIPYSVITGVDLQWGAMTNVRIIEGLSQLAKPIAANESIWLNKWAWQDLGIPLGEAVEVDYYLWLEEGRLVTRTMQFRLAGVVAIDGDVDSALAPAYPGITDARSIRAWDPPFPLDLRRIRPKDEDYWNRYRATPKAFVTLAKGQQLWQSRFGRLSGVRIALPEGFNMESAQKKLSAAICKRLNPEQVGFVASDVRQQGISASQGSTDFGEYFVYFSFFLIVAAILLSALFFRLGIEQRVREIGTLQAAGFSRGKLRRIFLLEGVILSVGGSLLGLLGSVGYGWLLVFGLRTWWIGAVGTQRISLHISWMDLGIGVAASIVASLATTAWTLRSLRTNSPRALLAGVLESTGVRRRRARSLGVAAFIAFFAACLLLLGSALEKIPDVGGFFGAGFLLLIAILSLVALFLRRTNPRSIMGYGWQAFFRLGVRNAMHRPGRSLLCVTLIAFATFIIVSVDAFRQDTQSISMEPASGTGGYPLLAQSSLPILQDPNSAVGREALAIFDSEFPMLAHLKFVPFRFRPGDDASCLNLYAPREPKILGATHAFVTGGRFSFKDSLASMPAQKQNPWLLLESELPDGAIPAIGDANTIQYILHLALGREVTVMGGSSAPVRLRLVAALRDSIFQGELLISEANFLRIFPEREGFQYFLLDCPPNAAESVIQPLEERLADWGFSVESSRERLAAYHQVENTYLSAFQSLGALGLILGSAGLATVLLRNVIERRRELALLRAVGYRRKIISVIILAENLVLLVWGLACGTICALLAILPALHVRGAAFPVAMIGLILFGVLIVGLISSVLAVIAAIRSPLLESLRST